MCFFSLLSQTTNYFVFLHAINLLIVKCDFFFSAILDKLLSQENQVLELWTQRKKRLEQCHQYQLFECSAQQAVDWIREKGDLYLSTHTTMGQSQNETQTLISEHNEFKRKAKVIYLDL